MRELVRPYVPNVRGKVATMVVAMSLTLVGSLGWTGFAELKDGHRVLWKSLTLGFQGMGLVSSAVLWGIAAASQRDAKLLATAGKVQVDTTLHHLTQAAALEMGIAADTNAPAPRDEMAAAKAWLEANRPATLPVDSMGDTPISIAPIDGPAPQITTTAQEPNLFELLAHEPALLVWGPQGSGKSTFAKSLAYYRQSRHGHQLIALDPHNSKGKWADSVTVIGSGMDYGAIDGALTALEKEIQRRYKILEEVGEENFNEPHQTWIAEEMTGWVHHCQDPGKFLGSVLSNLRKIRLYGLLVSHDRTLAALGGSSGMSGARDAGLAELNLIAGKHPETRKPFPSFRGTLKEPGQQPYPVTIPKVAASDTRQAKATLERIYQAPAAPETLTEDDQEILDLINDLRADGITKKTELIAEVWGANPGATKEYQQASAAYDRLKPYFN